VVKNPWLERTKTKTHGQKAEKRTAGRFGTEPRAGSGAIEGFKGDIDLESYLVENKATSHKSLRVTYDWLHKISKEALAENKSPALAFQFVDLEGRPIANDATWVCIPERIFKEILGVDDGLIEGFGITRRAYPSEIDEK